MFKKIDQYMVWALDDAPGIVRLVAYCVALPIVLLLIPLTWLVFARAKFEKWWQP